MMSERRISPGEINRYLSDIQREINDLEQKLEGLRAASGAMRAAAGGGGAAAAPRRRGRPPGSGVKRGPGRPPGRPPGSAAGAAPGAAAPAKAAARKRTRITPEQLASRQLQGRYLGLIRQIPATRRSQYQRVAKERGREAAIREMQDALKK